MKVDHKITKYHASMDHLKTDEERKDRWYARHVKNNYVAVHAVGIQEIKEIAKSLNVDKDKGGGCMPSVLSDEAFILGLPVYLLHQDEAKIFLKYHLENFGFVVIKDVLNKDECTRALDLAWDYVEAASEAEKFLQTPKDFHSDDLRTPVRREETDTYKSKYFPRSAEGKIFPFYGSGHSSFMWYLRSRPLVQEIFAKIHGVTKDKLITSLDGFILWNTLDSRESLDKGWFHIDQNPESELKGPSLQGLVNLLPVTSETGGNVLVCGSHYLFPDNYTQNVQDGLFYEDRLREIKGDDWLEIDPNDDFLFQSGSVITCLLNPGDVLIWDSRTVHCSCPGERKVLESSMSGLVRAAGLVNMIPRKRCSQVNRIDRLHAIKCSRTLTHRPDKAAKLGEERSEEAKKDIDCVRFMKEAQTKAGRKVLLSYEDLNKMQRNLV